MNRRWMKYILGAAGIYNILWGAWVVFFPVAVINLAGMEPPRYPQIWQCVGMIVACYGVGYLIAATDPVRWWPLVLVGLIGKVLGPLGFTHALITGGLPLEFGWMILLNDLIWWPPFAVILWSAARGEEPSHPPQPLDLALRSAFTQSGQSLWDLTQDQPALVVCLRHTGCTFCKQALSDLADQRTRIERSGVRIVLVHMSSDAAAERFFAGYGLADTPRISDPDRSLYRALGLSRGSFVSLLGLRVWYRGALAGMRGFWPGRPSGDGFQMPGAFLVHRGLVVRSYRHGYASDRPDYARLCDSDACRPTGQGHAATIRSAAHAG